MVIDEHPVERKERQKALVGRLGRTPEGYDWMRRIDNIGKNHVADEDAQSDDEKFDD